MIKGVAGEFEVLIDGEVVLCNARGIFRKDDLRIIPGDRVRVGENNRIDEIIKRDNELIRPPVANISMLVLVVSVKKPNPNLKIIDTVILNAELIGLKLLIVFNKADLSNKKSYELIKTYSAFDTVLASAEKNLGIDLIAKKIRGEISVFSGASGTGKSSILNQIIGEEYFEVGEISSKLKRGKNTTRHTEFYHLDKDTLMADSPGYTSLSLLDIEPIMAREGFREFKSHHCKFLDCVHINEPDCEVKRAVDKGLIPKSRYESYKAIYEELVEQKKY